MDREELVRVLILLEAEPIFHVGVPVKLIRISSKEQLAQDFAEGIAERQDESLEDDEENHRWRRHELRDADQVIIAEHVQDGQQSHEQDEVEAVDNLHVRVPEVVEDSYLDYEYLVTIVRLFAAAVTVDE